MNQLLGVLAKYWKPGAVKTRLAAAIGEHQAAELHLAFVRTLLARLGKLGDRRLICFTPADRKESFENLQEVVSGNWAVQTQAEGGLGERMEQFFADGFAQGARRVVLIGADSPNLPVEQIDDAFRQLDTAPVVLGPTTDGGYYLVGAKGQVPPIFQGIPFSSAATWRETVQRLKQLGVSYGVLQEWYDVDDRDGLVRLYDDLVHRQAGDVTLKSLTNQVAKTLRSSPPRAPF